MFDPQVAGDVVHAASVTGSPIADLFVSQGPMGTIVIMCLAALRYYVGLNEKLRTQFDEETKALRKQIDDEKAARLADANAARDMLLQMGEKVHNTTDDLAKIADRLEKTR
jgi:hypothetical protein